MSAKSAKTPSMQKTQKPHNPQHSQMLHPQIIVLDFGSQYTQLIARRLREMGIYTEIMPYFESAQSIKAKNPRGLILSGGPASVYEKDAYKPDSEIFTLGIPILGICYGMQFIAHFFGGQVAKSSAQEFGKANLTIIDSRGIFSGVKQDCIVWMSHSDKVIALPSGFSAIGSSANSEICAIADLEREIYAIQFHPEVVHSECGAQILSNFAREICGASDDWNMHNFAELEIAKVRKIVGLEEMDCHADFDKSARNDDKNSNNTACHTKPCEVSKESQHCHTERSEVSQKSSDRDISAFSKPQYDKKTQSKFNKQGRSICDEKSGLRSCEQRDKAKTPIEEASDKLRDLSHKGKSAKVLCAVSGGVDSSVVAALLHKAIGENLIPVFVDTGLLRAGEREAVEQMFKQNLQIPLITADASELFLSRLQGITEPEQKRKIIGESFIEVFEREARAHNANGEIKFLAQGTLYPDVIESVSVKGPSKTIKSHHNVGGLPEWMRFELIEPLRELFKDEVRSLGRELGIPESMLMRHPFPGPGLAIRIMGEVTRESLAILREADSIFIEELHKNGLYGSVWQAFCVLLNVRSVGVMGDNRTYDNTIALRAVEAIDGMTARFSHLSFEFLEKVSNRIINEVEGINRVVYDISSKPPATIEWE
ncbi:glutamine-hydrolyzing GMP synthase [Helicobacter sp. 23-1048]